MAGGPIGGGEEGAGLADGVGNWIPSDTDIESIDGILYWGVPGAATVGECAGDVGRAVLARAD